MTHPLAAVPRAPRAISRLDLVPLSPLARPQPGPSPPAFGSLLTSACGYPSAPCPAESHSTPTPPPREPPTSDPADTEPSAPVQETHAESTTVGPTPLAVLAVLTVLAAQAGTTAPPNHTPWVRDTTGAAPAPPTDDPEDPNTAHPDAPPANPWVDAIAERSPGSRSGNHVGSPVTSAVPPNLAVAAERQAQTPPDVTSAPNPSAASPAAAANSNPGTPDQGDHPSNSKSPRYEPPPTQTAPSAPPVAGTGGAIDEPRMNAALETDRTAGLGEQDLPPAAGSATAAEGTPDRPASRAMRGAVRGSAEPDGSSVPTPLSSWPTGPVAAISLGAGEVGAPGLAEPTSTPDLNQRLSTLIAGATVQLRRLGREDFEVTIQPEAGTEILLRVSLQGGGTEVQAELRRGDAAALQAHWKELQERLAQQGIKLAGLTDGPDPRDLAGGGSGSSGGRHPANPDQPAETPYDPDPLSRSSSTQLATASPRPLGSSRRPSNGWETWA